MRGTCFAALILAAPVLAQDRIDPASIEVDERLLKAFRGNKDQMVLSFQSAVRQFEPNGERLNLSTLEPLIELEKSAERGRFVGNFIGYDLNWDGKVTRPEYNSVFGDHSPLAEGYADHWAQSAASNDLNGDDVITLEELTTIAGETYADGSTPSRLKFIVEMKDWDLDGDGYVSQTEIVDVIAANVDQ